MSGKKFDTYPQVLLFHHCEYVASPVTVVIYVLQQGRTNDSSSLLAAHIHLLILWEPGWIKLKLIYLPWEEKLGMVSGEERQVVRSTPTHKPFCEDFVLAILVQRPQWVRKYSHNKTRTKSLISFICNHFTWQVIKIYLKLWYIHVLKFYTVLQTNK